MILGVHHIAITTPDLDRLSQFYMEAFGFEEVSRGAWRAGNDKNDAIVGLTDSAARMMFLRASNVLIEMFQYQSPVGKANEPDRPVNDAGYTHFCLSVTDIEQEIRRLEGLGMKFHAPVRPREADYPWQAMYGRDPDGNIVELMEFHDTSVPAYIELG